MIKILIQTDGNKVADKFTKEKVTVSEVGMCLLRLKQIEKELIDIEFKSDFEMKN